MYVLSLCLKPCVLSILCRSFVALSRWNLCFKKYGRLFLESAFGKGTGKMRPVPSASLWVIRRIITPLDEDPVGTLRKDSRGRHKGRIDMVKVSYKPHTLTRCVDGYLGFSFRPVLYIYSVLCATFSHIIRLAFFPFPFAFRSLRYTTCLLVM
jgi:hypothetical protein